MEMSVKRIAAAGFVLAIAPFCMFAGAMTADANEAATTEYEWSMDLDCSICHANEYASLGMEVSSSDAAATDEAATSESAAESATEGATEEAASAGFVDGTYEGTGKGIGGKVPVTVTVTDGKISEVVVGDNSETQGIGSKAIESMPAAFVGVDSVEGIEAVDGVSGATITSKALRTAVTAAVESAAGDSATDAASDTTEAAGDYTIEQYAAMHVESLSFNCTTCHVESEGLDKAHAKLNSGKTAKRLKKTEVGSELCTTCHVQEDLAAATADYQGLVDSNGTVVNPHDLPEVEDHESIVCTDCHKAHKADDKTVADNASSTCTSCHHAGVFECGTCH